MYSHVQPYRVIYSLAHLCTALYSQVQSLQTIAAYLHFHLCRLNKLQGKVMTHSEKVMNKSRISRKQVVNKSLTCHEQVNEQVMNKS